VASQMQQSPIRTFHPNLQGYGMKVSRYERVASLLIALLILIGAAVLIVFLLWLTSQVFASSKSVPVQLQEIGEGGGLGESMDLEVEEIGLETDLEDPEFKDTLATIADAVALKTSVLEDPTFLDNLEKGVGGRKGDGRTAGFGSGKPGKPRHWEVQFIQGNTLKTYARQLDFFEIELGVLLPDNKVEYAYNLSQSPPSRRSGAADQEKRYYLTWRQGSLQEADRELLALVGIQGEGRLVLKFIPPEVEMKLVTLERERAGDDVDKIRATTFQIRAQQGGYTFYVVKQTYR
jgi:hypothetical protein